MVAPPPVLEVAPPSSRNPTRCCFRLCRRSSSDSDEKHNGEGHLSFMALGGALRRGHFTHDFSACRAGHNGRNVKDTLGTLHGDKLWSRTVNICARKRQHCFRFWWTRMILNFDTVNICFCTLILTLKNDQVVYSFSPKISFRAHIVTNNRARWHQPRRRRSEPIPPKSVLLMRDSAGNRELSVLGKEVVGERAAAPVSRREKPYGVRSSRRLSYRGR